MASNDHTDDRAKVPESNLNRWPAHPTSVSAQLYARSSDLAAAQGLLDLSNSGTRTPNHIEATRVVGLTKRAPPLISPASAHEKATDSDATMSDDEGSDATVFYTAAASSSNEETRMSSQVRSIARRTEQTSNKSTSSKDKEMSELLLMREISRLASQMSNESVERSTPRSSLPAPTARRNFTRDRPVTEEDARRWKALDDEVCKLDKKWEKRAPTPQKLTNGSGVGKKKGGDARAFIQRKIAPKQSSPLSQSMVAESSGDTTVDAAGLILLDIHSASVAADPATVTTSSTAITTGPTTATVSPTAITTTATASDTTTATGPATVTARPTAIAAGAAIFAADPVTVADPDEEDHGVGSEKWVRRSTRKKHSSARLLEG